MALQVYDGALLYDGSSLVNDDDCCCGGPCEPDGTAVVTISGIVSDGISCTCLNNSFLLPAICEPEGTTCTAVPIGSHLDGFEAKDNFDCPEVDALIQLRVIQGTIRTIAQLFVGNFSGYWYWEKDVTDVTLPVSFSPEDLTVCANGADGVCVIEGGSATAEWL
jgi:hypothetical protein